MILSSDGLQQYFNNEEAVAKVESFITSFPDRDPAQLLLEEALFRAAKKAGKSPYPIYYLLAREKFHYKPKQS